MDSMNSKNMLMIVAILLALIVAGLGWYYGPALKKQTAMPGGSTSQVYINEKGERWTLPEEARDLTFVSSEEVLPSFVSADIDPLDVQLGEVQRMKVVVKDTVDVESVIAEIETDIGIITVPLNRTAVEAVTEADFLNREYFVKDGLLNILSETNRQFAVPESVKPYLVSNIPAGLLNTAKAQGAVLQKYTYEGEWTARDTHVRKYHTTFVATDSLGRVNKITMAWSDNACSLPNFGTGAQPISSPCTPPAGTSGWDGGNITVTANVTLNSSVNFAWAPPNSISIGTNGSFTLNGGKLINQCLYYDNGDGDAFAGSSALTPSSNCSASGVIRMKDLTNDPVSNIDCADAEPNVYPTNTNYYTSARSNGSWDYNCDGAGDIANPAPATGQCDNNSGLACDAISPNGSVGYTTSVSCGGSGTYVTDPGSSCGGVSCTTENRTNNCSAATQQYPSTGQCDNNSGNVCDAQTPNGATGWQTSVPSCGSSATYINNAGNYCTLVSCTTEARTQGCR